MKFPLAKILKTFIPLAFLAVCMAGLVYASVQQSLRQSANDPQIQMAEDAAAALENGTPPSMIVPKNASPIDIATSLAPYLIVFDDAGDPIAGNAALNAKIPAFPAGVFDYVRTHGEDRITWQPQPGVRSAAILVRVASGSIPGFVLAGRSLREVEIREDKLSFMTGTILGLTLAGLFALSAARELL